MNLCKRHFLFFILNCDIWCIWRDTFIVQFSLRILFLILIPVSISFIVSRVDLLPFLIYLPIVFHFTTFNLTYIKSQITIQNLKPNQIIMLLNFSKRQWSTLIIIGLADFANAICVSLQAPFFPQEVRFLNSHQKYFFQSHFHHPMKCLNVSRFNQRIFARVFFILIITFPHLLISHRNFGIFTFPIFDLRIIIISQTTFVALYAQLYTLINFNTN